jgi:hypothetical protein
MTTALRELERELLNAVAKRLAKFGFSPRPKGQTFYRLIDHGKAAVHVSFIEHASDVEATIDVAVRFDAVEDLVNGSNRLLSNKEKADTFTLGGELGNLEHGNPLRTMVAAHGDIPRAVDDMIAAFERTGLPYLERYSHEKAAYLVLSSDDQRAWVHCPVHAERAKRACALLVVMGRTAELKKVAAQKLSFLESLDDPGRHAFSRFVEALSTR